ncbi:EamA family transporter [Sphingomonas sp.]|uniref:EamA family transporter n=1 Tax=Sphingomonas sp. TaxID=28214 RepID=UPI0025DFEAEC|nr:EamA family transporter [Sphingomonas sp.]
MTHPVQPATLAPRHLLLAIAIMAVWGSNFVVIKLALAHLPPLLLAALRFTLVLLPAAFFLKRPAVSWGNLAAYGLLIGVGQFGVLFMAMRHDITPGLASLVMQVQVFFTIGLAMRFTGERIRRVQVVALLLAIVGLGIILTHTDGSATPLGLGMAMFAALCWAGGNMLTKAAGSVNMVAYVVWASLFSIPPLFALAFVVEGPTAIAHGIAAADAFTWGAVIFQSVANTMFGYGAWGWLLARYPAGTVAPTALLVPVFGMAASTWWLGESLPLWKLAAAAFIMAGLALGLLWPRVQAWRIARIAT